MLSCSSYLFGSTVDGLEEYIACRVQALSSLIIAERVGNCVQLGKGDYRLEEVFGVG